MPMAMTAHVVYSALDRAAGRRPPRHTVIREIIRGWIGFDGLLMSDDLSMKALGGHVRGAGQERRWTPAATSSCTATATWPRWTRSPLALANWAGGPRSARVRPWPGDPPRSSRWMSARRRNGSTLSSRGRWRHERALPGDARLRRRRTAVEDGEALIVDLDGFEGPLDVLLALARSPEGRPAQALGDSARRPVPGLRARGAPAGASPWPPTIWSWPPGSPT